MTEETKQQPEWEKEFDEKWYYVDSSIREGYGFTMAEIRDFIKKVHQQGIEEGREDVLRDIGNMKLWSKGTVEGTRQDILYKLAVKHGFTKDYQQESLGIKLEEL